MTKDLMNSGLLRDRYVADLFERLKVSLAVRILSLPVRAFGEQLMGHALGLHIKCKSSCTCCS